MKADAFKANLNGLFGSLGGRTFLTLWATLFVEWKHPLPWHVWVSVAVVLLGTCVRDALTYGKTSSTNS